jgi:putative flippase GtrA
MKSSHVYRAPVVAEVTLKEQPREARFANAPASQSPVRTLRARSPRITAIRAGPAIAPFASVNDSPTPTRLARLARFLRAGIAGAAATLVDVGTLAILVTGFHMGARAASLPALIAGGLANFLGNRHFAFRAASANHGSLARQAVLYTLVEIFALAANALLYDTVLRTWPQTAQAYWLVRLATSHLVFLVWSYPLWRRVFAVKEVGPKLRA